MGWTIVQLDELLHLCTVQLDEYISEGNEFMPNPDQWHVELDEFISPVNKFIPKTDELF